MVTQADLAAQADARAEALIASLREMDLPPASWKTPEDLERITRERYFEKKERKYAAERAAAEAAMQH